MSKQTAQGSPDGPKYIYGKENVNWAGPKRAAEHTTDGSASAARGDFASEENTTQVTPEQWDNQRVNSTSDFLRYMLEDEGLGVSSLLNLDQEELDEYVVDFIESSHTHTTDDYDAIHEELSEMETSRALKDLAGKIYDEERDTVWENASQDALKGVNYPASYVDTTPNLKVQWFERMVSGDDMEPDITYDDYISSDASYDDAVIEYEQAQEDTKELVQEWKSRLTNDDGEQPIMYNVGAEDFGWRNQKISGMVSPKDFEEDPIGTIKPNTQDFSQIWKQSKDETSLEITQYHHDSPVGETWYVKPLYQKDLDDAGLEEGIDY